MKAKEPENTLRSLARGRPGSNPHEHTSEEPTGAKMKIAYVYDAVYPYIRGGVEKRIHEIATRLAARGHDIHIYGMHWWDGAETLVRDDGVTLHGVCAPAPLYANGRRSVPPALRFAGSVLRPLQRTAADADIIDCQNFPYFSCFSAKAASLATGVPLAITWHEVWGEYWHEYMGWRGIFGKGIEHLAAGLTPHAIAVSQSTARALEDLRVQRAVVVIPNGIDLREISAVPPADAAGDGVASSDIIFAGRLIKEKNVGILLQAIAIISEEIPDIRATIIGDGPERERLEAQARNLGLEAAVTFTGFLPDDAAVIAAMKAARVFVLPSTREGFGMVALEAMACGLPVVTIDHPLNAARELVEDGKTGYRTGLQPGLLAEGIAAALASRDTMQDALFRITREYEWESIIERLSEIYLGVANP